MLMIVCVSAIDLLRRLGSTGGRTWTDRIGSCDTAVVPVCMQFWCGRNCQALSFEADRACKVMWELQQLCFTYYYYFTGSGPCLTAPFQEPNAVIGHKPKNQRTTPSETQLTGRPTSQRLNPQGLLR